MQKEMHSPQLLVKEGGRDLLFLTSNDGASCLNIAACNGHLAVVEVSVSVGVGCSGMSRACVCCLVECD